MQCKYCGGEIPHNEKNCPYCGREADEKEKIFIDRPVMVYEDEPEPDGLAYRKAKEQMFKYSAFCFILSVLSIGFGIVGLMNQMKILTLPQVLLALLSLGFCVMIFSICKKYRVKLIPFLFVSLSIDVLSLIITGVAILK